MRALTKRVKRLDEHLYGSPVSTAAAPRAPRRAERSPVQPATKNIGQRLATACGRASRRFPAALHAWVMLKLGQDACQNLLHALLQPLFAFPGDYPRLRIQRGDDDLRWQGIPSPPTVKPSHEEAAAKATQVDMAKRMGLTARRQSRLLPRRRRQTQIRKCLHYQVP